MLKYPIKLTLLGFLVRARSLEDQTKTREDYVTMFQGDMTLGEVRRRIVRDYAARGWRVEIMAQDPERTVLLDPDRFVWTRPFSDTHYTIRDGAEP